MSKAVFFDIDGTLFSLQKGIPESTRRALELLKETGTVSAICTGRCRAMMEPELETVGFPAYVCGAGTYVEYRGEVLYNKRIPEDLTDEVVRRCRAANVSCVLEGPQWIYYDNECDNPVYKAFAKHMQEQMGNVLIPYEPGKTVANKYSLFTEADSDIASVLEFLKQYFDLICHEDAPFVEVIPKGHSKATGIAVLLEKLGIDRRDTYAFGDSVNDLEMLDYVEYGIAMGNSCASVRRRARYVTREIEDGGIAWGLRHFNLIPKPKIAVVDLGDDSEERVFFRQQYLDRIREVEAEPVLIPQSVVKMQEKNGKPETKPEFLWKNELSQKSLEEIQKYAEQCQGLLLPGGVDIDPKYFGEEKTENCGEINPVRDVLEAAVMEAFEKMGKPVFGICRGIQAMNIFHGGTLYQDLGSEMEGSPLEHWTPAQKNVETQPVSVEKGTKLYEILGKTEIKVNSMHHQAVKNVAEGFAVSARCADGVIEAIEKQGAAFFLGVQWHPEHLKNSSLQQRLFEAFTDACL